MIFVLVYFHSTHNVIDQSHQIMHFQTVGIAQSIACCST